MRLVACQAGLQAILSTSRSKVELFWRHLEPLQGALEAYCRHGVRDSNAAEDVLQDAVAHALDDFDLFAEGTNFRAWIFRYLNLTLLAANRLAGTKPHVELLDEPQADDDWILSCDETAIGVLLQAPERALEHCDDKVAQAVRMLNDLERSVLLLKALGGFTYREIAEIIGRPMGTVMSALSRARQRMRSELAEYVRGRNLFAQEDNSSG